jgi:hypothetical protein
MPVLRQSSVGRPRQEVPLSCLGHWERCNAESKRYKMSDLQYIPAPLDRLRSPEIGQCNLKFRDHRHPQSLRPAPSSIPPDRKQLRRLAGDGCGCVVVLRNYTGEHTGHTLRETYGPPKEGAKSTCDWICSCGTDDLRSSRRQFPKIGNSAWWNCQRRRRSKRIGP